MTEPMTAEKARKAADLIDTPHGEVSALSATLRAYAAMKERQTVDREGVRSVVDTIYCVGSSMSRDEATDRILALLPAGRVSVKALKWEGDENAPEYFSAAGIGGIYEIGPHNGEIGLWIPGQCAELDKPDWQYPTEEAAKAAAQAHYEAAILSAVKQGPDVSGLVEALEKAAQRFADLDGAFDLALMSAGGLDSEYFKLAEQEARQRIAAFKGET